MLNSNILSFLRISVFSKNIPLNTWKTIYYRIAKGSRMILHPSNVGFVVIVTLIMSALHPLWKAYLEQKLKIYTGSVLTNYVLEYQVSKLPKRIILIRHGESEGNVDPSVYEKLSDHQVELTANGFEQSRRAGVLLHEIVGNERMHIYCSPYVRAKQTISAILGAFDRQKQAGLKSSSSISTASTTNQTVGIIFPHQPSNISSSSSSTSQNSMEINLNSALKKSSLFSTSSLQYTVTEEPRLREQEFGFDKGLAQLKEEAASRNQHGLFYYRFPGGESGADVYDRAANFLDRLLDRFSVMGDSATPSSMVTHDNYKQEILALLSNATLNGAGGENMKQQQQNNNNNNNGNNQNFKYQVPKNNALSSTLSLKLGKNNKNSLSPTNSSSLSLPKAEDSNLILVSHGFTIRILLKYFLHLTVEEFNCVQSLTNASMIILERNSKGDYTPSRTIPVATINNNNNIASTNFCDMNEYCKLSYHTNNKVDKKNVTAASSTVSPLSNLDASHHRAIFSKTTNDTAYHDSVHSYANKDYQQINKFANRYLFADEGHNEYIQGKSPSDYGELKGPLIDDSDQSFSPVTCDI